MTSIIPPVLHDYREETEAALVRALSGATDVALLDFPSHMNVGDGMIWAGEIAYLNSLGTRIRYACDIERYSFDALNKSHPQGPILLHGGGNLGDVWPEFQKFRERVVQDFPDRKIIQLPQTLYFGSPEGALKTDQVFGAHDDLTVMLRDDKSMQRAAELLPSVKAVFVRDMALGWSPDVRKSDGTRGVLILARQDAEAKGSTASLARKVSELSQVEVADWGLEGMNFARWKATKLPGRLVRQFDVLLNSYWASKALHAAYNGMLHMNLKAGVDMFMNRRLIITDRLHAHVLASLMQIPHIVLDNSYGKVKSIYDDYTHQFSTAHYASSNEEALELARKLLTARNGA